MNLLTFVEAVKKAANALPKHEKIYEENRETVVDVIQAQPNLAGAQLLAAIADESVRRVAGQFGANSSEAQSTRNRRNAFRLSPLLSDANFDPA